MSTSIKFAGRDSAGIVRPISVVDDGSGEYVLRIVDAAPFAYDAVTGALKIEIVADSYGTDHKGVNIAESVAASGSHVVTIVPPAGREWELLVLGVSYAAPAGATSGVHTLFVRYGEQVAGSTLFTLSSPYSAALLIYSGFGTVTGTLNPTDKNQIISMLRGIRISNDAPLYLRYENATDVANAGVKGYWYVVREFGVM